MDQYSISLSARFSEKESRYINQHSQQKECSGYLNEGKAV
jgi:hypothetical protein